MTKHEEPFRRWARETPSALAVSDISSGQRLTYADTDALVTRTATWLVEFGVRPTGVVAFRAPNDVAHVILAAACMRVGAVFAPLDARATAHEVAHWHAVLQPTVSLITHGTHAATPQEHVFSLAELGTRATAPDLTPCWLDPNALAMLLATSGTTGAPRAAQISVRQIIANAESTQQAWQLRAHDTAVMCSPFSHTAAWGVFAQPLWWCGGSIALANPSDAAGFWRTLHDTRATLVFAVPTQWRRFADALPTSFLTPVHLPHLRWAMTGGAACPPALARQLRRAGVPFREGFGMTEYGPNCFTLGSAELAAPPANVGTLVPKAEWRLVTPDGADVAFGDVGELWVRGPALFSGYWGDTHAALTNDGWFRTGDLLRQASDGTFVVVGRQKQIIISGGENIAPAEVELALLELPGVRDAVVVGRPDPHWGEVPVAFLEAQDGAHLTSADITAALALTLSRHKLPKAVQVMADLPRVASGKPDRALLSRHAVELA